MVFGALNLKLSPSLIRQLNFLLHDHEILWLDIAVNVALGVNVSEALEHLDGYLLNRFGVKE